MACIRCGSLSVGWVLERDDSAQDFEVLKCGICMQDQNSPVRIEVEVFKCEHPGCSNPSSHTEYGLSLCNRRHHYDTKNKPPLSPGQLDFVNGNFFQVYDC